MRPRFPLPPDPALDIGAKLRDELDASERAELEGEEEIPTDHLSFRQWVLESKPRVAAGS